MSEVLYLHQTFADHISELINTNSCFFELTLPKIGSTNQLFQVKFIAIIFIRVFAKRNTIKIV